MFTCILKFISGMHSLQNSSFLGSLFHTRFSFFTFNKTRYLFILGDDKSEEEIGPKLEEILGQTAEKEKAKVEPLTRDDSWRKDLPVREWDKGKECKSIRSDVMMTHLEF